MKIEQKISLGITLPSTSQNILLFVRSQCFELVIHNGGGSMLWAKAYLKLWTNQLGSYLWMISCQIKCFTWTKVSCNLQEILVSYWTIQCECYKCLLVDQVLILQGDLLFCQNYCRTIALVVPSVFCKLKNKSGNQPVFTNY